MKMYRFIIATLVVMLHISACSDTTVTYDPNAPLSVACRMVDESVVELQDGDWLYISADDVNRRFTMLTKMGNWQVVAAEENSEWTQIYPESGKNDGQFFVYLEPNEGLESRKASISILNSLGEVRFTTNFHQFGLDPEIIVAKELVVAQEGGNMVIEVKTNTKWAVDTATLPEWITKCVPVDNKYQFTVAPNDTGAERMTTMRFACIDDSSVYAETLIKQL